MSLRESNVTKAEHHKPDVFKSDATRAKEGLQDTADSAASYLPGQSKPRDVLNSDARDPTTQNGHDLGRSPWSGVGDALKPSGEQSLGERGKVEGDKLASHVQKNEHKSTIQNIKDAITPGNDSSLTPHHHAGTGTAPGTGAGGTGTDSHAHSGADRQGQGLLGRVEQAVGGAKEKVVNAIHGERRE